MKRAPHKSRHPFLVWWNEVAPNHEGASRFALAHLAWTAAKRDARKRRKAKEAART